MPRACQWSSWKAWSRVRGSASGTYPTGTDLLSPSPRERELPDPYRGARRPSSRSRACRGRGRGGRSRHQRLRPTTPQRTDQLWSPIPPRRRLFRAEAFAEAVRLLDRHYATIRSRGYEGVLLEAASGDEGLPERVAACLAEAVKGEQREMYRRWILAKTIETLSWDMKCRAVAAYLAANRDSLSGAVPSEHLWRFAEYAGELIAQHVETESAAPGAHSLLTELLQVTAVPTDSAGGPYGRTSRRMGSSTSAWRMVPRSLGCEPSIEASSSVPKSVSPSTYVNPGMPSPTSAS